MPLETRAESARVESGFEALDPVATKIAFDQEQRITRKPGDSVAESTKEKQFSQNRLDQLFERWDNGAEAFWTSYQERCEIVYEIQKETAKPGCKGKFSNALRRIRLSDSTAYDMIKRHRIRIGEIPDPDMPDLRDEVEENSRTAAGAGSEEWDNMPEPKPRQHPAPPMQDCPARTIKDHITSSRRTGTAGPSLQKKTRPQAPEPDWKALLIELIAVLDRHGDRLPLPVLNKKRVIETMLGGGACKTSASAIESVRNLTAYQVEKRGDLEATEYAVVHTATKKVMETFKSETEAESVATSTPRSPPHSRSGSNKRYGSRSMRARLP